MRTLKVKSPFAGIMVLCVAVYCSNCNGGDIEAVKVATLNTERKLGITTLAFTRDDKLMLAGQVRGQVYAWDTSNFAIERSFKAHEETVEALAVDPLGKVFATGGFEGQMKIWNFESWSNVATILAHTDSTLALTINNSGSIVATGGDFQDPTIKLWDLSTGELIHSYPGHAHTVTGLLFADNSTTLVSSSTGGRAILWSENQKEPVRTFRNPQGGPIEVLALAPPNKVILGGFNGVSIIELTSGKELQRIDLASNHPLKSIAVHNHAPLVALGDTVGNIIVWDFARQSEVWRAKLPRRINAIAFSNSGEFMAFVSDIGQIEVWKFEHNRNRTKHRTD